MSNAYSLFSLGTMERWDRAGMTNDPNISAIKDRTEENVMGISDVSRPGKIPIPCRSVLLKL